MLILSFRVDLVMILNFSWFLIINDKDDIFFLYNCVYFIYVKGGKYSSNFIFYYDNMLIIFIKKICISCIGG